MAVSQRDANNFFCSWPVLATDLALAWKSARRTCQCEALRHSPPPSRTHTCTHTHPHPAHAPRTRTPHTHPAHAPHTPLPPFFPAGQQSCGGAGEGPAARARVPGVCAVRVRGGVWGACGGVCVGGAWGVCVCAVSCLGPQSVFKRDKRQT